jgi:hypothetical protein
MLATASVTVLLAQQYLRPDVVHALKPRKVRTQLPGKARVSAGRERDAEWRVTWTTQPRAREWAQRAAREGDRV